LKVVRNEELRKNMKPKEWLLDYAKRKTRGQGVLFTTALIKLFVENMDDATICELFKDMMVEDGYVPKVWKDCVHTQEVEIEFRINIVNDEIDEMDVTRDFDFEASHHDYDNVEIMGVTDI